MNALHTKTYQACRTARFLAGQSPGRYGGRYIARDRDEVIVLDDDDPELYPDADIIAQVTPNAVYAIGAAREWLMEDGSVTE